MRLIRSSRDFEGRDPLSGLEAAAAAHAVLAGEGVFDPSEEQLLAAYAAAKAQEGAAAAPEATVNAALVAKAYALLATRLIHDPTEAEFLAACAELGD